MNRSMFVVAAMAIVVGRATAAELKPEAAATFDRYVAAQETRMAAGQASASSFLFLRSLPAAQQREQIAAIRDGELLVQKLGNPPQAGGALLHHWIGTVFIPGATAAGVAAVLQDYDHLSRRYAPEVIASRELSRSGAERRLWMRTVKHKVLTVMLDAEYHVRSGGTDDLHRFITSRSTRVAEVSGGKELPAGADHGFLWRLNTYWRLEQGPDGVIAECETISLTRDVPAGLGWIVRRMIQQIPADSLRFTLRSTRDAVEQENPTAAAGSRRADGSSHLKPLPSSIEREK